ncbi:MAG: phosphoribosylanthranilate isomerase [Pseudomonadota bacterium]
MARVKICGLKTPETVAACVDAGARYIGFNFYAKSKRSVQPDVAATLATNVPLGIAKVALVVDVDDAFLDALVGKVPLDMIQLHGAETPERVRAVKARYGLPVMKALGVATAQDVAAIAAFEDAADQLLLDAKPAPGEMPGGNGLAFDWTLLAGRSFKLPWMLAGGLTPDTVAEAIARTGALQVDVASGVESAPGVKDASLMRSFVAAAG